MGASEYGEQNDAELVRAAREGDLRAFDMLVVRYQGMITRTLFRFCPHQSDLEDLVQESFIKAYRRLHKWQPTAPFENWLRTVAYRTGQDYYRKSRRNPVQLSDTGSEANEWRIETEPVKESGRRRFENSERVHKILQELPPDDRFVLTLQYLEDLSVKEIAERTGWSVSKCKVRSFRARKKLQQILERHGIDYG